MKRPIISRIESLLRFVVRTSSIIEENGCAFFFLNKISEDGPYGTLSRQHSIPSRRCRIRDLSLERHSPMREQMYQSTINYSANGRAKPTQPPSIPQDYYGTITHRLSPGTSSRLSRLIVLQNRELIDVLISLPPRYDTLDKSPERQ